MTQEIVRELVDGEWVTRPKDVTGGDGSQPVVISNSEPTETFAGMLWVQTGQEPPNIYERTDADDGWNEVYPGPGVPGLADVLATSNDANDAGISNSGQIDTNAADINTGGGAIDSGGGNISAVGGTINAGNGGAVRTDDLHAATVAGVQILGGATNTDLLGFYGTSPVERPVAPATPNPQDAIDILVTLGLCSQAAP